MSTHEIPKAEYVKIRQHLLNMIYHAGREAVLLPSTRALAEQFDVARSTVIKAIKGLHEEGYIVTKKGLGNFSKCPMTYESQIKNIGVLCNGGKNLFHAYNEMFVYGLVALNLTKRDYVVSEMRLSGLESEERIEEEFRLQKFDALLYIGYSEKCMPLMKKLTKEKFPLVLFSHIDDGLRSYAFAFRDAGKYIGKMLAKEKRTELYFVTYTEESFHNLFAGFELGASEENSGLNIKVIPNVDALRSALDEKIPDSIFITGGMGSKILDLLEEKGVDYETQCRLIQFSPDMIDERFCGTHLIPDEKDITDRITQDIIDQMNGKELEPHLQRIPLIIKNITKQKG